MILPPPPQGTDFIDPGGKRVSAQWSDWLYRLSLAVNNNLPESANSVDVAQVFGQRVPEGVGVGAGALVLNIGADQNILASQIFGY